VLRPLLPRLNLVLLLLLGVTDYFGIADLPFRLTNLLLEVSDLLVSLVNITFCVLQHLSQLLRLKSLVCDSELKLFDLVVHAGDRALLCRYLLALDFA
jgi:hypothetical protein